MRTNTDWLNERIARIKTRLEQIDAAAPNASIESFAQLVELESTLMAELRFTEAQLREATST